MPRNAEEKCHVETYRMLTFLNEEIFPDKRGASPHIKLRQTRNTFFLLSSKTSKEGNENKTMLSFLSPRRSIYF